MKELVYVHKTGEIFLIQEINRLNIIVLPDSLTEIFLLKSDKAFLNDSECLGEL